MRQFYLVNEVGTTYFFDFRTSTLISDINNIGYEKENTYLTYENSFKKVNEKVPQGTISFSIVFQNGYIGYSNFLKFIRESSSELRLFYKVNNETKYMTVAFKSITKTQLESGSIKSELTLDKMSLWLNKVNYSIKINKDESGKRFPYSYPFVYSSSFNGEILVENNGEYKAPLYICIIGAVNNPEVEILKDEQVVSKLRLLVVSSNCTIEVNSVLTDQYMKMTEGNTGKNIYSLQDFTCDNFLFLERGSFKIRFKPGVNSVTQCKISVYEGYGGH